MSITILNDPQLSSDVYDLLMSRTPTLGSFCESSLPNSRIMTSELSPLSQSLSGHSCETLQSYRNNG
ncbi:hypothetical protein CAEBREN_16075 [Caenorhabditis brenneri]|uniref:Uncharacterized protein n=1 Tax=Caenorhabditis brenneri TaxID=135651 RepID=G0M7Y6_CAEBE|nr:hypothetical protein CAEBREN_16075 [Caenorhabditis brenneri]